MLFGTPPAQGGGGEFAITGVSGTKSHGSSIVISGAQFGTKSSPGPVIYDDASGTDPVTTGWSEAWPDNSSGGAAYNLAYRALPTTNGSVSSLPHSHITKAIAGAHNSGASNTGADIHLEYYRTITSRPAYTFASFWYRMDPNTNFNSASENWKIFDWGVEHGGYDLPDNWYVEYGSGGNSWDAGAIADNDTWWNINSDSTTPAAPGPLEANAAGDPGTNDDVDANGHNWHAWENAKSPFAAWIKLEYCVKWTQPNDHTGFVKIWENGVLVMDHAGYNDGATGDWANNTRYDMIGGYADSRGGTNWRYFCDVYYDHTLSRVILGNASTIGACTIKEPQVCTAWADGEITCTMKHGAIPTGTAYLYVFKADGTPTAGYAVTLV
jgi:hypothetical protein